LVDRILELNKKSEKEKIPIIKNQLERQIKATDNRIDRLVYEFYGLTEKEIAIVEKSCSSVNGAMFEKYNGKTQICSKIFA